MRWEFHEALRQKKDKAKNSVEEAPNQSSETASETCTGSIPPRVGPPSTAGNKCSVTIKSANLLSTGLLSSLFSRRKEITGSIDTRPTELPTRNLYNEEGGETRTSISRNNQRKKRFCFSPEGSADTILQTNNHSDESEDRAEAVGEGKNQTLQERDNPESPTNEQRIYHDCISTPRSTPRYESPDPIDALPDCVSEQGNVDDNSTTQANFAEEMLAEINPTTQFPIPPDIIWKMACKSKVGQRCVVAWTFDRQKPFFFSKDFRYKSPFESTRSPCPSELRKCTSCSST